MSLLLVSFSPAFITNHVIPVCLPKENSVLGGREECYVTGWGDTKGETELTQLKALCLEIGMYLYSKCIFSLCQKHPSQACMHTYFIKIHQVLPFFPLFPSDSDSPKSLRAM